MGDWIKENRFEAGMLVVVVLISVVAYLFGGKQGAAYQEHKEGYGVAANTVTQLRQKKPFPNPDNVKKYQVEIDGYRTVIEDLQGKLLAYRPAEFKKILPSEFIDRLNAARTKLAGEFTANGIEFDEKWHLGFESYTSGPPHDDATKYLDYQLDALTSLFESLVVSKPSALINVYRKPMPIEKGDSMDGGSATPTPSRGRPRGPRQAATTPPPFYRLPLELTFKAQEPAARKFIAAVASNKDYYFVIRSMRIQNEKRSKAPKKDDVEFDAPVGVGVGDTFDNSFDNELIPEGDPPEGDPVDPASDPVLPDEEEEGERVLGQVLGAEEVFIFLQLDLLLFQDKEDVKLP
jgi:hypothetical protein